MVLRRLAVTLACALALAGAVTTADMATAAQAQPVPTLAQLPGDPPATTSTTTPPGLSTDAARIDPLFVKLSAGGFAVALLIVLLQVILTSPHRRGHRTL